MSNRNPRFDDDQLPDLRQQQPYGFNARDQFNEVFDRGPSPWGRRRSWLPRLAMGAAVTGVFLGVVVLVIIITLLISGWHPDPCSYPPDSAQYQAHQCDRGTP